MWSKEEYPLGWTKYKSNAYSITQSNLPGSSTENDVHYECTGRMGARKYLRKSCCHRIKCLVANFLAPFMWRRPLNSVALATTIYRKLKRVSNGTNTKIVPQMINKCRIKIVQVELYKRGDPPWIGDWEKREKKTVVSRTDFIIKSERNI